MNSPADQRLLTFRSGGWVLLLAGLIGLGFLVSLLWSAKANCRGRAIGDGVHVESYGFDLAALNVPRGALAASGAPKRHLEPLDKIEWMTPEEADGYRDRHKYLVPNDQVIGVVIGNEARAYPLRVLVWHEIANDLVGSVPIAVTYSPLCDVAAVVDRRIEGNTLSFAMSGLLVDSCLVMYDVHHDEPDSTRRESLWSPLFRRAIAGPAALAKRSLELLPISVTSWSAWRAAHPKTSVIRPNEELLERYNSDPYVEYFGNDLLRFPVVPEPPPAPSSDTLWNKTPFLIVRDRAGALRPCALDDEACRADGDVVMTAFRFAWGVAGSIR